MATTRLEALERGRNENKYLSRLLQKGFLSSIPSEVEVIGMQNPVYIEAMIDFVLGDSRKLEG